VNFVQARYYSQTNSLHVRRSGWADATQWFIIWRGVWWLFNGAGAERVVRATDYAIADLIADDWTTMPAPLAGCPVDPTPPPPVSGGPVPPPPSSGGGPPTFGSPPESGVGGIWDICSDGFTIFECNGGPFGGPDSGTMLKATFSGLSQDPDTTGDYLGVNLNRSVNLSYSGTVWTSTFSSGTYASSGDPIMWTVVCTRALDVTLSVSGGDPSGGFSGGPIVIGDSFANQVPVGGLGGLSFGAGECTLTVL
jgi:hypothetical protein